LLTVIALLRQTVLAFSADVVQREPAAQQIGTRRALGARRVDVARTSCSSWITTAGALIGSSWPRRARSGWSVLSELPADWRYLPVVVVTVDRRAAAGGRAARLRHRSGDGDAKRLNQRAVAPVTLAPGV
jgi:hypothetical protein